LSRDGRNRATAGGLLALCLLAACGTSGIGGSGPLKDGGDPATECAPVPAGGVLSDGFEALRNTGTSAAVIQKVALADPHGLRILAAYVVPVTDDTLYGVRVRLPACCAP
jgi:hypothetical protein